MVKPRDQDNHQCVESLLWLQRSFGQSIEHWSQLVLWLVVTSTIGGKIDAEVVPFIGSCQRWHFVPRYSERALRNYGLLLFLVLFIAGG